jgi:hypothetical protein
MPRIADAFIDNAVYIYSEREDAEEGIGVGGSGFLVHVPFRETENMQQTYVVTNRHVVYHTPKPVIRLSRIDGSPFGYVTEQEHWTVHPDGDDVAVMPIPLDPTKLRRMSIAPDRFVTRQLIEDEDIGIGDDTIMIGRFIGHDGRQRNTPAVRFGNIAMMPHEKIKTSTGFEQEGFLVELRSMPGYSGSAVYIYSPNAIYDMSKRRSGQDMAELSNFSLFAANAQQHIHLADLKMTPKGPFLLGIDFSHLNRTAPVYNAAGCLHPESLFVRENTGMAGVVPAWKIADILYSEALSAARHELEERLAKQRQGTAVSQT